MLPYAPVPDQLAQPHLQGVAVGAGGCGALGGRQALLHPECGEDLERQRGQGGVAALGGPLAVDARRQPVLLLPEAAQEEADPRLPVRRLARERGLGAAERLGVGVPCSPRSPAPGATKSCAGPVHVPDHRLSLWALRLVAASSIRPDLR